MILQENVWNSHSQPSLCIKITGAVADIVSTCPSFGDRGSLFLLGAASLPPYDSGRERAYNYGVPLPIP